MCVCVWCPGTHREEDDGYSERYGCQHGETHTQEHGIKLINLGKGVQQLCLHVICVCQSVCVCMKKDSEGQKNLIVNNTKHI